MIVWRSPARVKRSSPVGDQNGSYSETHSP
jgi:hypothetical protein